MNNHSPLRPLQPAVIAGMNDSSPLQPSNPRRKTTRLQGYNYSQTGMYFITLCVQHRECLFGTVEDNNVRLNERGEIAKRCWENIPKHFQNVGLHEFVVMPNHIHGIIELTESVEMDDAVVGANNYSPLQSQQNIPRGTSRSVGSVVRGFKIGVTKEIGYSVWQRNYYDHILRNDDELNRIRQYILDNPVRWAFDHENPQSVAPELDAPCRGE